MLFLNLIYFTTIRKQVISTDTVSLSGSGGGARASFVWEETGVPGENPCDLPTYATGDRTRIALVRSESTTRPIIRDINVTSIFQYSIDR